jgi:RNA polymerase sigma-70 factor (ECF subfamily)
MVAQSTGVNAPLRGNAPVLHASSASLDARVVELYDQYFDFVWRSLRRLGVCATELDDAAQDVFVVVHRRLETFEERAAIKSWIFAIAMRVAKDYRRRSARRWLRQDDNAELQLVCTRGTPEEAHIKQQAAAQVLILLESLDDDKRAVFVLAELERMPAPDIAIALGIPVNTVYSRLRLARVAFEDGVRRLQAKDEWRYR